MFGGAHIATAQQRRIQRAERERLLETLHHPGASWNGSIGELLDGRWSPMPLRGRKSQLALMNAWLHDEQAPAILVITGIAGVGKTALALRFADAQNADPRRPDAWARGWLADNAGAAIVATAADCGDPALILIDSAASRPDIIDLLRTLAGHQR
ncbi:hypothetical protein ACWDRB_32005 [Nonomuraea sp. NPDC003707]